MRVNRPVKLTAKQMDRFGRLYGEYVVDGFRVRMLGMYTFTLTLSGVINIWEYGVPEGKTKNEWFMARACLASMCKHTFVKCLRRMERRGWFAKVWPKEFPSERR